MDLKTPPVRPINLKYPLAYSEAGGFQTNDVTVDAVADDLKILIKTNWGERVIQYDFGANLRSLLFEPLESTKQKIADSIAAAVEKWMPFVNIDDLQVLLNEDDATVDYHAASIKIHFSVGQSGLEGDVTLAVTQ